MRIKRDDSSWDSGLVVEFVSEYEVDEKNLPDSHKEIKDHRKMTGDNTPKVKNNVK